MSELVKALRDAYEETDKVYFNLRTIIKDAADTIDRLTAENARLDEELGRCTSGNGTYISLESHNRILAKLTEKLTAELTDYRALAAEYGIDGKTMLTLAKSQIETAKENAWLTERLAAAVELIDGIDSELYYLADIVKHATDAGSAIIRLIKEIAQWRGEESE